MIPGMDRLGAGTVSACGVSWCGLPYGKAEVPVSALLSPVATSKWAPAFCSRGCLDRATVSAGAVDRAGCPEWCGKHYDARGVPFRGGDVPMFVVGDHMFFFDAEPVWCSARCRDLALAPIDSKLAIAEGRGGAAGKAKSPPTPVRQAHGTPDAAGGGAIDRPASSPATPGAQPGGSRNARQDIGAAVAGSASLANVPPPSPAPGQRWLEPHGRYHFDVTEILTIDGQRIIVATSPEYKSPQWLSGSFDGYRYIGPTPATPTPSAAASPPCSAPVAMALGSREPCTCCGGVEYGAITCPLCGGGGSPVPKSTRAPGITCRHCLLTSAGGSDHLPACTRNDVLVSDSWLTSETWSTQVRCALERLQDEREKAARPFVPSITDEDLFGKPVRP